MHKRGSIPMAGEIVDASRIPAPKQRNTDCQKDAVKAGKSAVEIWPDAPKKAVQKDTDGRWALNRGREIRYRRDAARPPQIAPRSLDTHRTVPLTGN